MRSNQDVGKKVSDKAASSRSVYFFQFGKDGPVKIGVSADVGKRHSNISCGSPVPVFWLTHLWEGDVQLERALHNKFRHLWIKGEWFNPGKDLMAFVELCERRRKVTMAEIEAFPTVPWEAPGPTPLPPLKSIRFKRVRRLAWYRLDGSRQRGRGPCSAGHHSATRPTDLMPPARRIRREGEMNKAQRIAWGGFAATVALVILYAVLRYYGL